MNRVRRRLTMALTGVTASVVLAACGTAHSVTYAPAAYGQDGHCYWIINPDEATALLAHGMCPITWTPMQAPVLWRDTYFRYYSSPAYVTVIVPPAQRAAFTTAETRFGQANASAINAAFRNGTYRSSEGTVVPATKIGTARFSAGSGGAPRVATRSGASTVSKTTIRTGTSRFSSGSGSRSVTSVGGRGVR